MEIIAVDDGRFLRCGVPQEVLYQFHIRVGCKHSRRAPWWLRLRKYVSILHRDVQSKYHLNFPNARDPMASHSSNTLPHCYFQSFKKFFFF